MSFGDESATAFDVAATINHEEVAHGKKSIEKNEQQPNAAGHKSYYDTYTETSPDNKTVLTDKKYENTEANKNQKELQQILKEPKKNRKQ